MTIKLKPTENNPRQTMEGFGVSGAWWAQLVGSWQNGVPEEIARLLFHKTEGLGIGIYRYNLGGGSKESGKGTFGIKHRRASSFDTEDGGYDWSRDGEALRMLREALKYGVDEVVFFVNSPPERFTVTGKAQSDIPFRKNLKRRHEADFARYCLDVTEHFLQEGVPVKFLSPVNEPLWIWTGKQGQEGCHYHAPGIRRIFRVFAQELAHRPALDGKLLLSGAENGDIRLMNKTYIRCLLNDPRIARRFDGIDTHSYWAKEGAKRRYRRFMDRRYPGVKLRTSEWTQMKGGRDYSMDSALEQARVMWEDLCILNVVSWQHWIAVSEVDFCDGLIYIDEAAQTFDIPKRYYAFGNFSKFIPRGAQRVDLPCDDPELRVAAFRTEQGRALVLINLSAEEKTVSLDLPAQSAALYRTDETKNLEPSTVELRQFTLTPRSVNTLDVRC
ncbi:MAG: hypothetical protein LBQ33_06465 [Oscillospiraceae bacterium]|nr:hypothetical protein [Oscillospiraceae bacterium]